MYKNLYECFKHWYRGGQIFLYSDPHFGDDDTKKFRKNYIPDEEQVKRINSKIGKNDTIIFLGDIGNIKYVKKIRGYKILIMGNHDKGSSHYKKDLFNNKYLFDEVYEGPLVISEKIILSHEPIDISFMLNIHGHDHSLSYCLDNNHINICAEYINYYPIPLKKIVNSGVLNKIKSIHRLAIEKRNK